MSKLVIQRGHVPRKTGATGAPGEQALARRNAAEIVAIVKDLPAITPQVIDADEPTSRYAGDRFVALHGDGSANRDRREASVGYRGDDGRSLGQRWKTLYAAGGWPYGFLRDNYTTNLSRYYGTGHAVAAGNPRAIIVEHGFLTSPEARKFLESDAGVKLAAAAVIVACYPEYDLDRLLTGAPKPEKVKDPEPEPSTSPSAAVITVGDTGSDVRSWQKDLQAFLPGDRDAHRADGDFGPKTARWTARAMVKLGLVKRAPVKPIVGPLTRTAMAKALTRSAPAWSGRKVRAKTNLRFYDSPRWSNPVGVMKKDHHFPTIEDRVAVGGGYQYRVRNSRGKGPYYVTASSRYVKLV